MQPTFCPYCRTVRGNNWVTVDVEEELEVKAISEIVNETILRIEVPL